MGGRQGQAEHGPGVPRVDDAVVVELRGHEERVGLALDLGLDRSRALRVGVLVERRGRRDAPTGPPTIDSTPASCAAPITASLAPGQANTSRGS